LRLAVTANRFYSVMLLVILALLGYLSYVVIRPFLVPIAWAIVISILFYPVYLFLSRYVKIKSVASGLTVLLVLIVIIGPLAYTTMLLVGELQRIGEHTNEGPDFIRSILWKIRSSPQASKLISIIGEQNMPTPDELTSSLRNAGRNLAEYLSVRITNLLSAAVNFLFMTFTIFFLFRDGPGFLRKVRDYMPFSEDQKTRLESQINDMIASTVYGGVAVAGIQGLLGGLAFFVLGLSAPVLWGIAMAIMSFIPLIGTLAIWGPAAIYLITQGNYLEGIGLILYGTFIVGLADNFLRPWVIGSRTKMPTIVIFFSVLGGIEAFGIIGLIMGPLIMAVFISVFEIFRHVEDDQPACRGDADEVS
jgi:predicted PurR-regulated permease PerM